MLVAAVALSAPADDWVLYLRCAGQVRVGMSLAEVRRVLGDPQASLEGLDPESVNNCAHVRSARLPDGLGIMFSKGRLVRLEAWYGEWRTAAGVRIGDTEARVRQLYPGRIHVERHHYVETGHYLRYTPASSADRDFGLLFETDGEKVTSVRAGTLEAVALVEGCA
ncbi:MAG: hypothetical protein FJW31_12165 [Acidobacteria bacterium]|nr:hypothetical protein [Acidobacteriota bacterium]